jgi:hypothetical protein
MRRNGQIPPLSRQVASAWSALQGGLQDGVRPLEAALSAVTSADERRAKPDQQVVLRDVHSFLDRRTADRQLVSSFRKAGDDYHRQQNARNARAFADAADSIGRVSEDLLAPNDQSLVSEAQAARLSATESAMRLDALRSAYQGVLAAERSGKDRVASYEALSKAAAQVRDFDTPDFKPDQYAAMKKAGSISDDMNASAIRTRTVLMLADQVLQTKLNGVSRDLYNQLHQAAESMGALDRERLSPEQRFTIFTACNVRLPVMPGVMMPKDNTSCPQFAN